MKKIFSVCGRRYEVSTPLELVQKLCDRGKATINSINVCDDFAETANQQCYKVDITNLFGQRFIIKFNNSVLDIQDDDFDVCDLGLYDDEGLVHTFSYKTIEPLNYYFLYYFYDRFISGRWSEKDIKGYGFDGTLVCVNTNRYSFFEPMWSVRAVS